MSSPFDNRYGSHVMRHIFSDDFKFGTWRKLWVALAESESELGVNITPEQIHEMKVNAQNINIDRAVELEKQTHHDVMAHILAFGEQCPTAKPIIHLGATSCFVTDNTEVFQQKYALLVVRHRLIDTINALIQFADLYKGVATVGYTHYQIAQPTTVGKRACMWIQDLMMDLDNVTSQLQKLKFLGCKGATGTAVSFMELFDGDEGRLNELERRIAERMNMTGIFPISGQTYTRKQDFDVMQSLSGIAQSASKFANDIRLLSNLGEVVEVRDRGQVGSSAMPYKSNPINCERINSLGRFVICNLQNCAITTATQWMERTLDDSANRRVIIPETFLAIDEILVTYRSVVEKLRVNENVIAEHLDENRDTLVTELVMMHAVKRGEDRQEIHKRMKELTSTLSGEDLHDALLSIPEFHLSPGTLSRMEHSLTGAAEYQAKWYLKKLMGLSQLQTSFFDMGPDYD